MSRSARVLVLVLAEDETQFRFVYHYLRQRLGSHEIRSDVAPAGKGSGEQWVREHYADEVREYRTRAAQTRVVIVIDADSHEVNERERQLQQALEQARLNRRSDREQIVHLIPKRNIETWIHCLAKLDANEDEDYKNRHNIDVDALIKPAAIAFFEGSRQHPDPPAHWILSLRLAIPEVRRLD